jgi:hypothetical protein
VTTITVGQENSTPIERYYTDHGSGHLGPDTGQMLSTYIVEADQPLATFVE